MTPPAPSILCGWGRTSPSAALVLRPRSIEELATVLSGAGRRGVLARGLGRAYGDAAQNAGGVVVDTSTLAGPVVVDDHGLARVSGGTSLDRIIRTALPGGWFVPVTAGTRQVTVGGALAADIHGKNHHADGSFAAHVARLVLLTPKGLQELTPEDELFWATAGGMGLTGIVLEADLRLLPVESSRMLVDTVRTADLDQTLTLMTEGDAAYRYSVCWIDCVSRGRHLGRSALIRGDHATVEALPSSQRRDPLAFAPTRPLPTPPWAPSGLLNPLSIRIFNEVVYHRYPRREEGAIQTIGQFFHPLDGVTGWNRLYGPRGFLQYQILLPLGQEEVLRSVITRLSDQRCPSFLGVLKRFGPGDPGPLSFPGPGWTLALDMPVGLDRLANLLDHLDHQVAEAGGRVYLAKDSRLRPELVPRMYPRLDEWRRVRAEADPSGVMASDLARRLDLLGDDR